MPLPAAGFDPVVAPAVLAAPATPSPADVLNRAGFGDLFAAFGHSLAISPRQQGITDERFLRAWERDAVAAFGAGTLGSELVARLGDALEPSELTGVADFLDSPFGRRIAELEHRAQSVPASEQVPVLAKGQLLYWRISEGRRRQLEELVHLSGAEVSFALLAESLRGMAVSLHLATRTGDIAIPWEEIEGTVATRLADMEGRLLEATRATFAYTYDTLSDDEIAAYASFMRSPAAQKFYGTATLVVGDIIRRTMAGLGASVAARLNAVQI